MYEAHFEIIFYGDVLQGWLYKGRTEDKSYLYEVGTFEHVILMAYFCDI